MNHSTRQNKLVKRIGIIGAIVMIICGIILIAGALLTNNKIEFSPSLYFIGGGISFLALLSRKK